MVQSAFQTEDRLPIGEAFKFSTSKLGQFGLLLFGLLVISFLGTGVHLLVNFAFKDTLREQPFISLGISLLVFLYACVAQAGVSTVILRIARNEDASFADFMSGMSRVPTLLGTMILYGIVCGVGLLLLVLPGLFLLLRLQFSILSAIDTGCNPIEALTNSWNQTSGVFGKLILLWLVNYGLSIGGILALGIGLIPVWMIIQIMHAYLYLRLKDTVTL